MKPRSRKPSCPFHYWFSCFGLLMSRPNVRMLRRNSIALLWLAEATVEIEKKGKIAQFVSYLRVRSSTTRENEFSIASTDFNGSAESAGEAVAMSAVNIAPLRATQVPAGIARQVAHSRMSGMLDVCEQNKISRTSSMPKHYPFVLAVANATGRNKY
ncbi:hypothetical protein BCV70DRAFT_232808 [Testicularia cyperi]|uniref:Uncharacterized protein n=1 Tax=Testicularia cyperi TaxID=1882483 RepID=A0A317XL28_9BASI|nr:hypothetical protein BCV70DRAFT_232808 [Testicularia cyperi]